jgi:hypothetical protein
MCDAKMESDKLIQNLVGKKYRPDILTFKAGRSG